MVASIERGAASLRQELHDLCQPLTRLQWRLELGLRAEDSEGLRETVEGALEDAKELMDWVRRMRCVVDGAADEMEQKGSVA